MNYSEAKKLFEKPLEKLFSEARSISDKKITFYKNAFVPISITGEKCELNCKHCSKIYLKHMLKAENQKSLINLCLKLQNLGNRGIVLSGGCTKEGIVPLHRFSNAIRRIKEETSLITLAHTGVVDYNKAKLLGEAGLDGALVDVVGSSLTTKEIFGIEICPNQYVKTLEALNASKIRKISPHIIVGLHYGKIRGEIKALSLLKNTRLDTIVIVVLIPTKATPLENIKPPSPEDVGRIVAIAKLMYPDIHISLGCVRPGGIYRGKIDEFAIKAGASKVAIPSTKAKLVAKELGLKMKEYKQMCCGWI